MSSILQQRAIGATVVDLCSAMDLIAFISKDGILAVHRTISWEKVFDKKSAEINNTQPIISIKFSPNGRYLAAGFASGDICLVDIEHNYIGDIITNDVPLGILGMTWIELAQDGNCDCPDESPLFLKVGPENIFDYEIKDEKLQYQLRLLSKLHNNILIVLSKSGELCFFAYGSYFIWKCCIADTVNFSSVSMNLVKAAVSSNIVVILLEECSGPNDRKGQSLVRIPVQIVTLWPSLQRLAYLQKMLDVYLRKIEETTAALGKKWKDCNKVIPPKLSLMQGVISGYEMKFSPIQLYHTVALCGLWHPAASTSFSSQWNDQGLSRFRNTLDSTCKLILRCLQFKIAPILTNIYLICREYQTILQDKFEHRDDLSRKWKAVELHTVYALFAVDNAILEGKYAKECMVSYIQFVKDCFLEATQQGVEIHSGKYTGPDLELRQKCRDLFQPRDDRPPATNPEHVTGTHLFAHFQDFPTLTSSNVGKTKDLKNINISRTWHILSDEKNDYDVLDSIPQNIVNRQSKVEEALALLANDLFSNDITLEISEPLYLFNQIKVSL